MRGHTGGWAGLLTGSPVWLRCPRSPHTSPAPHLSLHFGHSWATGQSCPGAPEWAPHTIWPIPRPQPPPRWTVAAPSGAWPRPPLAPPPGGGGISLGNPGLVRTPLCPQEVGSPGYLHTNQRAGAPHAPSLSLTASTNIWLPVFSHRRFKPPSSNCPALTVPSTVCPSVCLSTCPFVQAAFVPPVSLSHVCSYLCLF